jgi:hypothetical protein
MFVVGIVFFIALYVSCDLAGSETYFIPFVFKNSCAIHNTMFPILVFNWIAALTISILMTQNRPIWYRVASIQMFALFALYLSPMVWCVFFVMPLPFALGVMFWKEANRLVDEEHNSSTIQ